MISLENISKTFYSTFGEPKKVFQRLNLEIQDEDFISVIG
ncbi:ABC transporter ATP-binding protein, partial [Bacteroides pyogenes]